MKIVICSPQLGISPDTNSGGEVYDREVLKHLAKEGVVAEILLPKKRRYEKNITNWQVTHIPIKTIFPPYIFNFIVLPYLFKLFKKTKFNLVRVHNPYFVGLAAVFFKFITRVPTVASYLHLENRNLIFTLIDKLIIQQFDHIITISKFTKNEIHQKYKVPLSKISVTYPGVGSQFMPKPKNPVLLKKFSLENKKVLLYLGGLKFRKNVSFLLDLLKEIKDNSVCLLIAGEGNASPFLKLKTRLLGLDKRVKFAGYIQEREKVDYFNLADVFLMPSRKEGFGMIAAEAQVCGKPVLVSDTSSLPETLKTGKTGFVCRAGNKKDWLKKIHLLTSNDKLRRSMAKNAYRFAKSNFSWEKNAKDQKAVFIKLLKK